MSQDSKQLSEERFSRYAAGYVTSEVHAKGADLDRLLEVAQPQADWQVLDVATGGGHTALKFAPHVAGVVASDLTPRMLETAEQFIRSQLGEDQTQVQFKLADAEALPFEAEQFDLVSCRIAPHHFPDVGQFVRESARVLKKGGRLIVQDHLLPDDAAAAQYVDAFEKKRDPSHNRAFNRAEWIGLFEAAGLEVEHAEQVSRRHDFAPWVERQACSPEVVAELVQMMQDAPPLAAEWLDMIDVGTETASFLHQHILIMGRKA